MSLSVSWPLSLVGTFVEKGQVGEGFASSMIWLSFMIFRVSVILYEFLSELEFYCKILDCFDQCSRNKDISMLLGVCD